MNAAEVFSTGTPHGPVYFVTFTTLYGLMLAEEIDEDLYVVRFGERRGGALLARPRGLPARFDGAVPESGRAGVRGVGRALGPPHPHL